MKKITDSRFKTAHKLCVAAFIGTSVLFVAATSASAQLVGVDFGTNPTYSGLGELGETFTPVAGTASGSQTTATTEIGTSGVKFGITDNTGGSYSSTESASAVNLFTSFIVAQNPGSSFTFTFSGLTVGAGYNLALYAGDLGSRAGDNPVAFTINGVVETPVGPVNGQGSFVLNSASSAGNFEIVTATANSLGDISILASNANPSKNYAEINGIGLSAASPAPEPSTWALMFASLVAVFGFQILRRRNA